jgi:hypothetical protein
VGQAAAALRRRRAHTALGYSSWGAFYEAEFGQSGNYGYRLLKSAEVVRALEGDSPNGNSRPASEAVARELAPLRDEPDDLRDAWEEAVSRFGEQPTAAQVREVVEPRRAPAPAASTPPRRDLVGEAIDRIPGPTDLTFSTIIDFAEQLQRAPVPDEMWLPPDQGNREAFDSTIRWLAGWAPVMLAAWERRVRNPQPGGRMDPADRTARRPRATNTPPS